MKTRLLFTCLALFLLTTSASSQMVTFYAGILEPAKVTLPERINKFYIASVGDEVPEHADRHENVIQSICQLKTLLESTGRYTVELTKINADRTPPINASVPAQITWDEVGRVTHYDTNALLIVLEQFLPYVADSGVKMEQRFWRMYDFSTNSLRDEFDHRYKTSGYAHTASAAAGIYADRIMMHWEWVQRDYYKGGNAVMKAAWHCLDSSDWEGAAEKWKAVAQDSLKDPKVAARACYNMAVYCELNGDINGAVEWIARSKRLGNVLAAYYGRIIRERTDDIAMLDQQQAQQHGQIPLSTATESIVYRQPKNKLGAPEPRKVPYDVQEARRKAGIPVMTDPH